MAKLGTYYGLCPLIDQQNLLGVCEDVTPGCVTVTLGRNMAIKYKLSDQKQIVSWSTKEKFSTAVIYDYKNDKYVGVFNQYFMRFWEENEENLEKIKKYKFPVAIHSILSTNDNPIVIFKNGLVMTLSHALDIRKEIPQTYLLDEKAVIKDQICLKDGNKYFVGMLLKTKTVYSYMWILPNCERGENNFSKAKTIELRRSGAFLIGQTAMITENGPVLYTLWSDGRLFSHQLTPEEPQNIFENYSVIESLSRQQPVRMLALNETYIAMYGADTNQEGASLQIYNIQFKVTQSKLALKLFAQGAKLWLVSSNILLTISQHLAVVPFYLATEQLAAIIGSHKLASANDDDVFVVTEMTLENWTDTQPNSGKKSPKKSLIFENPQVADLIKEGWSEAAICEDIFPKLFENNEIHTILQCLDCFSDISENVLVKLLSYCLRRILDAGSSLDVPKKGIPGQYGMLLDKILTVAYSEVLILPHLRTYLHFDEVLILLQYLCFLLSDNGRIMSKLDATECENKIIEWGCGLIDAHYQQLLLSKDDKVVEILEYFKNLIDSYMLCLDDLKKVEPILYQFKKGKCANRQLNANSLKYSIEKANLY